MESMIAKKTKNVDKTRFLAQNNKKKIKNLRRYDFKSKDDFQLVFVLASKIFEKKISSKL